MEIKWAINTGHYELSTYFSFNLDTLELKAEIETSEGKVLEILDWNENKDQLKLILEEKFKDVKSRIFNNKNMIFSFSQEGKEKDLMKAEKHLEHNLLKREKLEAVLKLF